MAKVCPHILNLVFSGSEDDSKFIVPCDKNYFTSEAGEKFTFEGDNKLDIVQIIRKY